MTQTDEVLAYIHRHGSITAYEAMNVLGCYRLAARISDLRKAGVDIESERVTQDGSSFARYRLVPKPVQLAAFG